MGRPLSVGVLHPTFESWGGAEWFIHGLLDTWSRRNDIDGVLYTYRWCDPPGAAATYEVVAHGLGGILSGPWDWRAIGQHLAPRWRNHDVLFFHNYPSGQWMGRLDGIPPFVWYCHEPPRSLWDPESKIPSFRPSRVPGWQEFHRLNQLGPRHGLWRVSSRLRLFVIRRLLGNARWHRRLRNWDLETVRAARAILANSHFTADRVRRIYGKDATVAYPLLPHFQPAPPPGDLLKERIVLWVGRLTPEKRPSTMLEAWHQLVENGTTNSFRLVLVGDGPLRASVEEHVRPLIAGGHATWHRRIPAKTLRTLYRHALLTVHLGRNEPFGLVPLESLWEGTPVLAACEGGVRETVIPGETGYCLDHVSPPDIARTLAALLSRPENLRDRGAHGAALIRERFQFPKTLQTIQATLRNAAAPGS